MTKLNKISQLETKKPGFLILCMMNQCVQNLQGIHNFLISWQPGSLPGKTLKGLLPHFGAWSSLEQVLVIVTVLVDSHVDSQTESRRAIAGKKNQIYLSLVCFDYIEHNSWVFGHNNLMVTCYINVWKCISVRWKLMTSLATGLGTLSHILAINGNVIFHEEMWLWLWMSPWVSARVPKAFCHRNTSWGYLHNRKVLLLQNMP